LSSEEARAQTQSALQERLERMRQRVVAEDAAAAGSGATNRAENAARATGRGGRRAPAREPRDPSHARYDHGLAEFPAFRFGKRRRQSEELIRFTDTIGGPNGRRLEREWTVYPSAKWGYGGATTQALLFDLHQIWKDQGFHGTRIYFGTLRKLYQRQHPGKNPAPLDYGRLRRDLDILCGYEFDCANAFWDPASRSYGNMRAWHLFTGWYEARRTRSGDVQEELPFGFIEVSDTFAQVAQERGFFVTGFDSAFFHSLRPVEQRLALYLSKMFASQKIHRRYEDDIYGALPIESATANKRRQTLREAADGLARKGYPNLAGFSLDKSPKTGRWVATFRRHQKVEQEQPVRAPSLDSIPPDLRPLVEDIVERTKDPGSIPMWVRAIRGLGEEAVRFALADLRAEQLQRGAGGEGGLIKNPGAWLTTKLMAMAKDRGIVITRHRGETRRP
jgi:hypothetical protein